MSSNLKTISLQQKIIDKIIRSHSSKAEATQTLMELLGISRSSLYRKMNDKSPLKPKEIELIKSYYTFSLDELIHDDPEYYFFTYTNNYPWITKQNHKKEEEYLLELVAQSTNVNIFYAGSEIPIFYFYYYPELIHFKKYIWKQLITPEEEVLYDVIDFSTISQKERNNYVYITRLYENLNSIELWEDMGISSILEQIKHYFYLSVLTPKDAHMLLERLEQLIKRLERMLQKGSKSLSDNSKNLTVYYNPIPSPNWLYLVESDTTSYAQTALNPPNSLISKHPKLLNNIRKRFNAVKQQSLLISETGIVQRKRVFHYYKRQINQFKKKIDIGTEFHF